MQPSLPEIPRLRRAEAALLCIDVQEKLVPAMFESERVVRYCSLLIKAARQLQMPVFACEQNPEKLGTTMPALELGETTPTSKMRFSGATPETLAQIEGSGRRSIVLCGLETHVCVLQTALDLRARGYAVFVVNNAVSSRYQSDKTAALARMASAGCILGSVEMFVFELLETADSADFRALRADLK
jgi:nicotinamidase-related amidase